MFTANDNHEWYGWKELSIGHSAEFESPPVEYDLEPHELVALCAAIPPGTKSPSQHDAQSMPFLQAWLSVSCPAIN